MKVAGVQESFTKNTKYGSLKTPDAPGVGIPARDARKSVLHRASATAMQNEPARRVERIVHACQSDFAS